MKRSVSILTVIMLSAPIISLAQTSELAAYLGLESAYPQPVNYAEPILDSTNNTAVFTAYQVDNIVATQGVISFYAGNVMFALRLSDGTISFNGGTFYRPGQTTVNNTPTGSALPSEALMLIQTLDVTGDELLNIGGGLLGDEGLLANTTLEDLRSAVETRINTALAELTSAIEALNQPSNTVFDDAVVAGELDGLSLENLLMAAVPALAVPAITPQIDIALSVEGAWEWSIQGGSIGSAAIFNIDGNTNPIIDQLRGEALSESAGGPGNLALVFDLAAKTRSIRVSTLRDNGLGSLVADDQVDVEPVGGVTGFTSVPFNTDALRLAFEVGNTDYAGPLGSSAVNLNGYLENNAPTDTRPFEQDLALAILHDPRDIDPAQPPDPFGVFDSGVQIVSLTDGIYDDDPSRLPMSKQTSGLFAGTQAFAPIQNDFNDRFAVSNVMECGSYR